MEDVTFASLSGCLFVRPLNAGICTGSGQMKYLAKAAMPDLAPFGLNKGLAKSKALFRLPGLGSIGYFRLFVQVSYPDVVLVLIVNM
jgi:hypothetical protein